MECSERIAFPFSARSQRMTSTTGLSGLAFLNGPRQVLFSNGRNGSRCGSSAGALVSAANALLEDKRTAASTGTKFKFLINSYARTFFIFAGSLPATLSPVLEKFNLHRRAG